MRDKINTMVYGESDRDRCDSFILFATCSPNDIRLYLAAGTLPFSQERPLKEQMFGYIRSGLRKNGYSLIKRPEAPNQSFLFAKGVQTITIILISGNGYGTSEETLLVAEALGLKGTGSLMVFSSASHLGRIKEGWNRFAPGYQITTSTPVTDMNQKLIDLETSKTKLTKILYLAYRLFGRRGFFLVSYVKNLLLNVVLKVQQ